MKKSKGREGKEEEGQKTILCVKWKMAEEIVWSQTSDPPTLVSPSLASVTGPAIQNSDQNPISLQDLSLRLVVLLCLIRML